MNLLLARRPRLPDCTLGDLSVDGRPECVTLELPIKDGLPGSAIPDGAYPIVLAPSPKFMASKDNFVLRYAHHMPHIIRIPMRTLIMLHWGNLVSDTDGCVLVGQRAETNVIVNSRLAFESLFEKINAGILAGGCTIDVRTA